jgi:hypothetical protein
MRLSNLRNIVEAGGPMYPAPGVLGGGDDDGSGYFPAGIPPVGPTPPAGDRPPGPTGGQTGDTNPGPTGDTNPAPKPRGVDSYEPGDDRPPVTYPNPNPIRLLPPFELPPQFENDPPIDIGDWDDIILPGILGIGGAGALEAMRRRGGGYGLAY